MATLSATPLTESGGSVRFTIQSLESPFTTQYYISVGISNYTVEWGASYVSDSVIEVYPPSSGGSTSATFTKYGVGYGTFTYYAYARSTNGLFYPAGNATVTITSGGGQNRPPLFYWQYAGMNTGSSQPISGSYKTSGLGIYVTADEWNGLINNVNAVRQYRGLSLYPFTNVYSGTPISAQVFNQVIDALSPIGTNLPSYKSSGNIIAAYDFNRLMEVVNAV